jgi:hypothetical protein
MFLNRESLKPLWANVKAMGSPRQPQENKQQAQTMKPNMFTSVSPYHGTSSNKAKIHSTVPEISWGASKLNRKRKTFTI